MMRKIAHVSTLPETEERNPAKQVSLVARFASIRQKLNDGSRETEKNALDKLAAPWLDSALSRHPNLKAVEEQYGCEKAFISQVRNGHVAAPLRFLVPLLDCPDVIHEFASQLLVSAGLPTPPREHKLTRTDVLEIALAMLAEGPLLKSLIRECADKFGAQPEDVLRALSTK